MKRLSMYLLLGLVCGALSACDNKTEPVSASASPKSELSQFDAGKKLYRQHCYHCHDVESGDGPRLKAKVLATHKTAQRLFKYNKKFMPYGSDFRLNDQEYWAITAFLIKEKGLAELKGDLKEDSAELALQKPEKKPTPSQP